MVPPKPANSDSAGDLSGFWMIAKKKDGRPSRFLLLVDHRGQERLACCVSSAVAKAVIAHHKPEPGFAPVYFENRAGMRTMRDLQAQGIRCFVFFERESQTGHVSNATVGLIADILAEMGRILAEEKRGQ